MATLLVTGASGKLGPRALHLLVAVGAAQDDPATCIYRERLMGFMAVSSYRFGTGATVGATP